MAAVQTSGTAICPRCGEAQPGGADFCPHCGWALHASAPGVGPPAPPGAPTPLPPPMPLIGGIDMRPTSSAAPGPTATPELPAPSAIGRRASRLGWAGALLAAAAFLAVGIGMLAAAGQPDPKLPTARWDPLADDPATIAAGEPFEVAVEAANPATTATDRVWLVVDWRPAGTATPTAAGRLVACEPTDCQYRNDPAAGITVIVWPGIPGGAHRMHRVTLAADGLVAGQQLTYRLTAGSGAAESRLRDSVRWTLAADVR